MYVMYVYIVYIRSYVYVHMYVCMYVYMREIIDATFICIATHSCEVSVPERPHLQSGGQPGAQAHQGAAIEHQPDLAVLTRPLPAQVRQSTT